MNRTYCGLGLVGVLFVTLAIAQPTRFDGRDRSQTRAIAAVESLQRNLQDSRRLLERINDRELRKRLETLLARAALNANDLEALLAGAPKRRNVRPLAEADFGNLLANIKDQSFDNDKVRFIEAFVKDRPIDCEQAAKVLKALSFDDGRVKAAVALYPSVVDPENFYEVLKVFSFESKRKQVMEAVKKLDKR